MYGLIQKLQQKKDFKKAYSYLNQISFHHYLIHLKLFKVKLILGFFINFK